MKYNFKGFSEKANEALNNAIISAEELGHTYVGSEHILLGILNTDDSVALSALKKFDITAEKLESQMRKTIGSGTATRLSPDYFTPRAKRVIETAVKGAASLGKSKVGTEYLLVGILSESDTYAVRFCRISPHSCSHAVGKCKNNPLRMLRCDYVLFKCSRNAKTFSILRFFKYRRIINTIRIIVEHFSSLVSDYRLDNC